LGSSAVEAGLIVEEPHDNPGSNPKRRWNLSTDENIERILQLSGWEALYTYSGAQV